MDEEAGLGMQAVVVDEFELVQGAGDVEVGVAVSFAIKGCERGEAVHAVAEGEIAVGFVWWRRV